MSVLDKHIMNEVTSSADGCVDWIVRNKKLQCLNEKVVKRVDLIRRLEKEGKIGLLQSIQSINSLYRLYKWSRQAIRKGKVPLEVFA